MNSTPDNIGRNAGIFYVMFQSSGLIGNTFSYFQFKESYEISDETRFVFVSALLVISSMATCTLLFVLPMPWAQASATAPPHLLLRLHRSRVHLLERGLRTEPDFFSIL